MNILVTSLPDQPTQGLLRIGDYEFSCALGRSGINADKKEGDGATPAGAFSLREVFYRDDRVTQPVTGLPVRPLKETDGWCDDPNDPNYNRLVVRPLSSSHERMWRDDNLYDVVVVIGYNDNPPLAGLGSAIFMHGARPGYLPTEGCVALKIDDLLAVLKLCDKQSKITMAMGSV